MITPMDIHNKTFSRQIRGYAQDEVNTFLEELAKDYERIYREHREMEEEMDTIRTKLRNYEKMEATMSNTLVMAQETADNVKKNAHKEAELSIREAQNEVILFFNYSGWITVPCLGSLVSSSITCISLIVDPSPSSTQLIGSFQSSM